jgi:transcriptional regulator
VFHGPHAYVSPSWYGEPAAMVPTWNYATVHAHGAVDLVEDPVESRRILEALVHRFEAHRDRPWELAMPEARVASLVGAIVAFRMRIRRLDAKFKLSQNRTRDDRARVIAALEAEAHPDAEATARWMRAYADPDRHDAARQVAVGGALLQDAHARDDRDRRRARSASAASASSPRTR